MNPITELRRLPSPAPKPQSLVWGDGVLWMGSRQTKQIFALDPETMKIRWQADAPGVPYGMTFTGDELRVLCGETADDNRFIRRCIPYHGFDPLWRVQCPDDTGSQLSFDGERLYVTQWYPKKLIQLGPDGEAERVISVPHGICGQVFVDGVFYLMTTDAEDTDEYWVTRVDPRTPEPKIEDVARVSFAARALAWDGERFWTNHREQNEIVAFEL